MRQQALQRGVVAILDVGTSKIVAIVGGHRFGSRTTVELLHPGLPRSCCPEGLPDAPWSGAVAQPDGRVALWAQGGWSLQFGVWDPASGEFEWMSALLELPEEREMLAGLWSGSRNPLSWHGKEDACDFFDLKVDGEVERDACLKSGDQLALLLASPAFQRC